MNPLTSIIDLFKYALKALGAYFELKKETAYFDSEKQFLKEKEELRDEITKLRNKGTTDATDRADRMFMQLQEIDGSWKRVSAAYSRTKSGD